MGLAVAGETHYMTFPHELTGRTRENLTVRIFKNGVYLQDIPWDLIEHPDYCYTVSFKNDGTDKSTWTCIVSDSAVTETFYVETWEVRSKSVEANIKQVRTRMDSTGGVFGKSVRGGE